MASLTIPSFPTSLQLRLLHPRPPRRPARFRFRRPDPRIRAAGPHSSWTADAPPDSFAGWSAAGGPADPPKSARFGGVVRAGLAGLLFVAGVTVASVSLSSRTTSGVKQHMEPLTSEHEVTLTSDDSSITVAQDADESSADVLDKKNNIDQNLGSETNVIADPSIHKETDEIDTEGGSDNIHHLGTSGVQHTEPTDNGNDTNNAPVPSDVRSAESSAYDAVDVSSDATSFEDSHSVMSGGTQDLVVGHDSNLGTMNHAELPSYSSDIADPTTYSQKENLRLDEKVDSNVTVNPFGSSGSQTSSEVTPSTLIVVESSNILDADIEGVVKLVASISKEEDSEFHSMPQLSPEANTSDPLVFDTNEIAPPKIIDGPEFYKKESVPPVSDSLSVSPEFNEEVQSGGSLSFDTLPERIFSSAGIPAPSAVSAALQLLPGKVLVPAVVDQVQKQTLAALQVLKVIEADVQPGDLCTRREYSRWLVAASSALSRNTISKVYPAMYIENVTELAFDDVTPEDPDFQYIQGLAEAGIISSRLSKSDSFSEHETLLFCPESPLSRQDLVSWKLALEKRLLPEVERNDLYQCSGYIDIDKINPDAWPALRADLSSGEHSITSLAFGYTRLFQPNKPVTKAQAAIALATGDFTEVIGEELTRIEAESLAESAVNAHTALVAQVENDLSQSFVKELAKEREKMDAVERMAEEVSLELERLRAEREGENKALMLGRATIESEMEILSRLRHELEEQLQELISSKTEISFERDRIDKLRKEAESENQVIVQLQYELEVERKALSIARSWAEDEAKKAREHARALEEARDRWERQGIKVVVDEDLQDDATIGTTWLTVGEEQPVVKTINRAESLVAKLKEMSAEIKVKSSNVIEMVIQKILSFISALKQWALEVPKNGKELQSRVNEKMAGSVEKLREKASELSSNASRSIGGIRNDASEFGLGITEKARRVVEDCKGSVDKISQKFRA